MEPLREDIGELRVPGEPGRRGEQRLEQGREAGRLAADVGGEEQPRWQGPGQALGMLPVAAFNEHADDVDGTWEQSAALTAAEFVRVDRSTARNVSIASRGGPEDAPQALVEVVLDGLLDDSVRARRYVLELRRTEQ